MKINNKNLSILNMYQSNTFHTSKAYFKLYNFFVTNSLIDPESFSYRTLKTYGWSSDKVEGELKKKLDEIEVFNNIVIAKSSSDVYIKCEEVNMSYNKIGLGKEQAVVQKDSNKYSIYYVLYAKVRDALSHGNFRIQKNKKDVYMFIAEDYSSQGNLNARMVVKVKTLTDIVDIVDRNNIIKY